jgi:hypothetical protein
MGPTTCSNVELRSTMSISGPALDVPPVPPLVPPMVPPMVLRWCPRWCPRGLPWPPAGAPAGAPAGGSAAPAGALVASRGLPLVPPLVAPLVQLPPCAIKLQQGQLHTACPKLAPETQSRIRGTTLLVSARALCTLTASTHACVPHARACAPTCIHMCAHTYSFGHAKTPPRPSNQQQSVVSNFQAFELDILLMDVGRMPRHGEGQ